LRDRELITDASIVPLVGRCTGLLDLDLYNCSITDASIEAIAKNCPKLKVLFLNHCGDESMVKLVSGCTNLRELHTFSAFLTDTSLFAMARSLADLRELSLDGSPVTDAGLIALMKGCPLLHSLQLANNGPHMTDTGIEAMSHLMDLHISHNPRISSNGLVALIRRCPSLTSLSAHMCSNVCGFGNDDASGGFRAYVKQRIPLIEQSHPALWKMLRGA